MKLAQNARHLEVQILADEDGNAMYVKFNFSVIYFMKKKKSNLLLFFSVLFLVEIVLFKEDIKKLLRKLLQS